MEHITQILTAVQGGDQAAAAQLLPLVYDELRRLAALKIAHEAPGHTLSATALVHEAYLRLVGDTPTLSWNHRGHFYAAAAKAMRRILVEHTPASGTARSAAVESNACRSTMSDSRRT
jgi:RNA polymerase sigma factor (TIGR02999 family)